MLLDSELTWTELNQITFNAGHKVKLRFINYYAANALLYYTNDSNVLIYICIIVCFAVLSSWPFFFLSNHLHLQKTNKTLLLLVLRALLSCLSFLFFFFFFFVWQPPRLVDVVDRVRLPNVLIITNTNYYLTPLHNLSFKLLCPWVMHIYLFKIIYLALWTQGVL